MKIYNKPCVYAWVHNEDIIYIGSTINLTIRAGQHLQSINSSQKGKQKKYLYLDKYQDEITFEVIEYCDKDELLAKEILYIQVHKPKLNTLYIISEDEKIQKNRERAKLWGKNNKERKAAYDKKTRCYKRNCNCSKPYHRYRIIPRG